VKPCAPRGRIQFLDGMRGIAALYVVLFHVVHLLERDGRGPDDKLVSFQAFWLERTSPKPGSVEGGPVERTLFTEGRFRR